MSRSTRALYEQNRQIQLQKLETTFFELLKHLSLITADIYVDEQKLKEREIDLPIPYIHKEKLALPQILSLFTTYRALYPDKNIQVVAEEFFFKIEDLVDFYFDTISIILRFLNSGKLDEHLFYRDLLSAQMSTDELLLLFYYSLPHPKSALSKNIKESKLLKVLSNNDLIDSKKDRPYLERYTLDINCD
ncbi:MAG: putative phage abortive infection protein [Parachlamydiaceae bacterium]